MVPQNLKLPYQFNKITFDFGTHELAHPNLVVYQYRLEGYDKDWSPVTKNTSATYGNMHEGNYTFKVKARYTGLTEGNAGNWTKPISYFQSVCHHDIEHGGLTPFILYYLCLQFICLFAGEPKVLSMIRQYWKIK